MHKVRDFGYFRFVTQDKNNEWFIGDSSYFPFFIFNILYLLYIYYIILIILYWGLGIGD